ncbi:MAG: FmdB family zinc ribbon protein, partial [Anaerolineae bacterium]
MPTYQYKCEDCGVRFERFQHFSEQPLERCPECDGSVRRVIQPVGVIFKGSGFYVTDNKKTTALTSKPEHKVDGDAKTEAKAEAKEPAAKTDS